MKVSVAKSHVCNLNILSNFTVKPLWMTLLNCSKKWSFRGMVFKTCLKTPAPNVESVSIHHNNNDKIPSAKCTVNLYPCVI